MDPAPELTEVRSEVARDVELLYEIDITNELTPAKKGNNKVLQAKPPVSAFMVQKQRCQFYQAPVLDFAKWYNDYPFAKLLKDTGASTEWEYRLIFLNPSSSNDAGHDSLSSYQSKVLDFYSGLCKFKPYEKECIEYSVNHDATIALIRSKKNKKGIVTVCWAKNRIVEVLSAITFCEVTEENSVNALVTFMGVIGKETMSWRRLRMGTFLLVLLLKVCVVDKAKAFPSNAKETGVELYVQHTTMPQMLFFESVGFVRVIERDSFKDFMSKAKLMYSDGHEFLSERLKEKLSRDDVHSFRFESRLSDQPLWNHPTLLKLPNGGFKVKIQRNFVDLSHASPTPSPLRRSKRNVVDLSAPTTVTQDDITMPTEKGDKYVGNNFTWCRYPPSVHKNNVMASKLTDNEFVGLLKDSPEISKYLPPPLQGVLPASSHHLHGEMSSTRRFEHTYKTYMSDGELEMMLALIMGDGRYHDSISIVPLTFVPLIEEAATKYGQYEVACCEVQALREERQKHRDDPKKQVLDFDAFDRETQKLVAAKQESCKVFSLQSEYALKQAEVVKNVLIPDLSMLEKRLLIIPICSSCHWTAVFVFNPSYIKLASPATLAEGEECLQPCFYCYDPIHPYGTGNISSHRGTIWFLNLVYSYSQHIFLDPDPQGPMKWQSPFPDQTVDENWEFHPHTNVTGTDPFPSLRVHKEDVPNIPLQEDGWNCGFGVVSAIAIIARDFIGASKESRNRFDRNFQVERMEKHYSGSGRRREVFAYLPAGHIQPMTPKEEYRWKHFDYLKEVRLQWFKVLDDLAVLQHDIKPFREGNPPSKIVHDEYMDVAAKLTYPDWKNPISRREYSNNLDRRNGHIEGMRAGVANLKDDMAAETNPINTEDNTKAKMKVKSSNVKDAVSKGKDEKATRNDAQTKKDDTTKKAGDKKEGEAVGSGEQNAPDDSDMTTANNNEAEEKKDAKVGVESDQKGSRQKDDDNDQDQAHKSSTKEEALKLAVIHGSLGKKGGVKSPSRKQKRRKAPFSGKKKPKLPSANNAFARLPVGDLYDRDHNILTKMLDDDPNRQVLDLKSSRLNVPWLPVPKKEKDFESNNWDPNWRKVGKGDPVHFFDDASIANDDEEEDDEDEDEDNELPPKTIDNYNPMDLTPEKEEAYRLKWKEYKSMGKSVIEDDEMEKYIDERFVAWKWSSNAQHIGDIYHFRDRKKKEMEEADTEARKEKIELYYNDLEKAIIKERRHFRRQFATDFRLKDAYTVTGLRYISATKKFVAKIVHKRHPLDDERITVQRKKELETYSSEIEVSHDWVFNQSGLDDSVIQHVLDMHSNAGFFDIPTTSEIEINGKKIVRVAFVPKAKRNILDVAAISKLKVPEDKLPPKRRDGDTIIISTSPRKKQSMPTKLITVPEHFRAQFVGGVTSTITESELAQHFSEKFINEVKKCQHHKKFVDVPVGDCKASHLHRYPHLFRLSALAPTIKYVQSNNEDLCVSNSLASALFNIGFRAQAEEIVKFGKREVAGGTVDALEKVVKFASTILPQWLQVRKKPSNFDWNTINEKTVFVGVLYASDGSSSHAISIHGSYIYDANEENALPLCQEALDYCTSTATVKSTFLFFRRGFLFQYTGKKKAFIQQMTRKRKRC